MKKIKEKAVGGNQTALDFLELKLKHITQSEVGQFSLSVGCTTSIPEVRKIWREFLMNNQIVGVI